MAKFLLPSLNPEEKMVREALTSGQTYAKGVTLWENGPKEVESELFGKLGGESGLSCSQDNSLLICRWTA